MSSINSIAFMGCKTRKAGEGYSTMTEQEALDIVKYVEDSEGKPRLDNMVRQPQYQFAKGYLAGMEAERGKVKRLREAFEKMRETLLDAWGCLKFLEAKTSLVVDIPKVISLANSVSPKKEKNDE